MTWRGGSVILATAIAVTDAQSRREIEQSKGLTLVDFPATWCPSCRLIEPILDEIAVARRGEVKVATLNRPRGSAGKQTYLPAGFLAALAIA